MGEANTLLDRLRQLNRETQEVLRAAREEGDHDLRTRAISRAEKQLELEGMLLGELNDGASAQVNIQVLAPVILEALTPFAVDDPALVGGLEALGGLLGDGERFIELQWAASDLLVEGFSLDQLHRQEGLPFGFVDLMDRANVGMRQGH